MADTMLPTINSPSAIRWTRNECAKLEEAGILDYRYELIDGVINKKGQRLPHALMVMKVLKWLLEIFGDEFVVTQTSIDVSPEDNPTSEPLPDAIVLSRPGGELLNYPQPEDIRLLVEVSDTTLRYDLKTKSRLYARAGIKEYWVVDLNSRSIHVHRKPQNSGYKEITKHNENETIATLANPSGMLTVSRLFSRD